MAREEYWKFEEMVVEKGNISKDRIPQWLAKEENFKFLEFNGQYFRIKVTEGRLRRSYTMRQNKDVFELFHNFDIPLNYPYL